MRYLEIGLLAVSLALAGSTQAAEAPFSFDDAPGRLPKNVVPLDYHIVLAPNLDAHTLRGTEEVTLNVRAATTVIEFNSLNQKLDHVLFDGKPVKSVVSDDQQQMTHVTLAAPAGVGKHRLSFSYDGKIESKPYGMFTQTFTRPDGRTDMLLSTKFEATDARRMFPCWDEPAFRATFQLTVTVPSDWAAISNMPVDKRDVHGKLTTIRFLRSPSMPTYLVELTAGDLAEITDKAGATKLSVWAARGQEQDGKVALANAKQILADYNDYFGYPFPLPKLDSIAIPGGFTGAMENWGAITYNDQILLVTPSSTIGNKQTVFGVQAHEMAHQWNGDLVTMGWWDDLWLNESFASWRSAKETDQRFPDWKWWEGEDRSKEQAMNADARQASHPIQQHVTNELEARSAFDPQITYSKGQAVLRMLEAYIGPDIFRDGIRGYMKARAFSNATSADLWNALDAASGRKVSAVAATWTEQPGFPVISVATQCAADGNRTLSLTQKRFLLEGSDADHLHWSVPLQVRVGADAAPQAVLLSEDGQSLPAGRCDQPLSLNADAVGYFRVAYDDATLQTDIDHFASLTYGDRIALLDDQWALAESGQQKLPRYLALAAAMGTDLDERAWAQITDALGTIERDERGTPGHDAFSRYARSIVKPLADKLGWDAKPDETPAIQRLRRKAIEQLGAWGDETAIAEARRRFDRFLADPASLGPDDQAMVLSIVAINADAASFDKLHEIARSARSETDLRRYFHALMQVRDPQLAARAAEIALSPEIPPQAATLRLELVVTLVDHNPALAWSVFRDNVDSLMSVFPQYRELILAQYIPDYFWNAVPLDEMESWLTARVPVEMAPNLARGMQGARFKMAEKDRLVAAADGFLAAEHR